MSQFHDSNCNGFGDMWWTDNLIYFSSIESGFDRRFMAEAVMPMRDVMSREKDT